MDSHPVRAATASEQDPANSSRPVMFGLNQVVLIPLGLTIFLGLFTLLPRISQSDSLVKTFGVVCALLLLWQVVLMLQSRRTGRVNTTVFAPVRVHYVQATVQLCVYVYWGWHWPKIYEYAPLLLAQIVFLYVFDNLLTWSRRREWRLGFGAFPIIFSTNLFLWFRDDWFGLQFLMVAVGALGKEFIKWTRDGKKTHIFNPSGFSLSVFSLVLLLTGSTSITWGEDVATKLGVPYMYVLIFAVGLVVQGFFSVTLMTLAAAVVLWILNLIYTGSTGVYHFIDSNIPIAVFLGLHLLVTDPSTSPRTNLGRVLFGALYGLGVFVLYAVLSDAGVPKFYDKLLAVPLLNLSVKAIDGLTRWGPLRTITLGANRLGPRKANLFHMAVWIAVFAGMVATGFVGRDHEGSSPEFWRAAAEAGRPGAVEKYLIVLNKLAADGSPEACNELGVVYAAGGIAKEDPVAACVLFARAFELGSEPGCANLAIQYLFYGRARSEADAARALDHLEARASKDGQAAYLLGVAYLNGRGRPVDRVRAETCFSSGCAHDNIDACLQLARMRLFGDGVAVDHAVAARALEKCCAARNARSCMHLAYLLNAGLGGPRDEARALSLLEKACQLGDREACEGLRKLRAMPPPAPAMPDQ